MMIQTEWGFFLFFESPVSCVCQQVEVQWTLSMILWKFTREPTLASLSRADVLREVRSTSSTRPVNTSISSVQMDMIFRFMPCKKILKFLSLVETFRWKRHPLGHCDRKRHSANHRSYSTYRLRDRPDNWITAGKLDHC